jgi:hypothetical protein
MKQSRYSEQLGIRIIGVTCLYGNCAGSVRGSRNHLTNVFAIMSLFEGFAAIAGRGVARCGNASGELPLLPGRGRLGMAGGGPFAGAGNREGPQGAVKGRLCRTILSDGAECMPVPATAIRHGEISAT